MRKHARRSSLFPATSVLNACFFCALIFACDTIASPTTPDSEIARLRALAETNPDQATQQLETLQQNLSGTNLADQKKLLEVIIPLYIDAGAKEKSKQAISSLTALGSTLHDPVAQAMATIFQANVLADDGQLGEALEITERALVTAKKLDDKLLIYQANSVAGDLYSKVGNFQNALQHQLAGLDALGNTDDRPTQLNRAKSLDSIGKLYLRLKNPATALEYNAQAKDIAEKIGADALMATIANNLGYAYADQQKWEPAIAAYQRGLAIARRVGRVRDEIVALNNMADAAMNHNQFAECADYTSQAIVIAQKNKKEELAAIALGNQGACHLRMGQTALGNKESIEAANFLRENKNITMLELMLGDLAETYKKMGMYREAFGAKDEQYQLATELFHGQRDRAVMELQVRFDVNQRQKEIEALEQKNRLQNSEIQNKNLQRIIAILAILVAIAIAATTFILYRKVRKSNQRLRKSNRQLEHKSTHDQLTGLLNRRAFEELMKNLSVYSPGTADSPKTLPSFLALLDIDHFKRINDTHGHSVGDLVLVELGQRLQGILREKDMVIRWGGEEFMIYLHGVPVERIRHAISRALTAIGATKFQHEGRTIPVTVSIGFIQMPLPGENGSGLSWEKAMHFCDEALYMAKNAGRNQAIGVKLCQDNPDQLKVVEANDLPTVIDKGLVEIQTIAGPEQ